MASGRAGTARERVADGSGRDPAGQPGHGGAAAVGAAVLRTGAEAVAAARAYAESVAAGVIERDRAGAARPPFEELAALDASGLMGITVPHAFGGPELGATVLAEVIRTIAMVDPALAQIPQGHFLFCDVLAVWGSAEQQRRLFAEVLDGARFGNGQAERGGQHAQDLKTRLTGWPLAVSDGAAGDGSGGNGTGEVVLTGKKYYTTGSLTARWIGVTALDDTDSLAQVDPALVIPYVEAFAVPQQLGARSQLVHTAVQVGGALRDGQWFVRDKARPFFEAARAGLAQAASQDPNTINRFGQLATKVRAAEALLASTAEVLDEVGRVPALPAEAARWSIATAQAKAFASEVATEVASGIFELSGASAADEKYDLSRHCRNARTHASHDPVSWKYHHIGNYLLNDVLPPNHGQL